MKSNLLLLALSLALGCAGTKAQYGNCPDMPSTLVKRAVEYLGSDQADTDAKEKGSTDNNARGKCLPDDLILNEVEHDPFHQDVKVSFILRHSLTDIKPTNSIYGSSDGCKLVSVKIDQSGHCQIYSAGESSNSPDMTNLQNPIAAGLEFEQALIHANRFIEEGKVSFSKSDLKEAEEVYHEPGEDRETEIELAKLENIIRKRIPQRIRTSHLKLVSINRRNSSDDIEITYSITPTIIKKSSSRSECLTLEIRVDKVGNCKVYDLGQSKRTLDSGFETFTFPIAFGQQQDDIFEAVFRHMFKIEKYTSDGKLKMRFLTVGRVEFLNDPFFQRFKDDKIPSRSPYKRYADYKGTWNCSLNQYLPNFEDAILYEIDQITPFDKDHVFVRGTVRWGMASGTDYIYTVARIKNKWKVIRAEEVSFF